VGPFDPTDRFTWWVRRVSRGGEILAPLPEERPIQIIHASDLAAWILDMVEGGRGGVYHATGPRVPHTLRELLETCREVSGAKARWRWAPESFFTEAGVRFWQDLPLCAASPDHGVFSVDVGRAEAVGLRLRPLAVTVRDTLAWDARRPAGTQLAAGLAADREAELHRAWRARFG
jgi:2'-hydroxyisoflavone reductase